MQTPLSRHPPGADIPPVGHIPPPPPPGQTTPNGNCSGMHSCLNSRFTALVEQNNLKKNLYFSTPLLLRSNISARFVKFGTKRELLYIFSERHLELKRSLINSELVTVLCLEYVDVPEKKTSKRIELIWLCFCTIPKYNLSTTFEVSVYLKIGARLTAQRWKHGQ